jgi:hypothetical protein
MQFRREANSDLLPGQSGRPPEHQSPHSQPRRGDEATHALEQRTSRVEAGDVVVKIDLEFHK